MRHHRPRQFASPSGAVTVDPTNPPSGSLALDPNHTGINPGIAPPTITISTTASSTSTEAPPASSSPSTGSNARSGINTGAISGIIVGIFVALAGALVFFMSIRHKKRMQKSRARAKSAAQKSIDDDQELQMRTTAHGNTASVVDTRTGEDSFLSLNSTHALALQHQLNQAAATTAQTSHSAQGQPALPSQNPFLSPPPSQSGHGHAPAVPSSRTTDESHIPNPFTSPPPSPSHSPSPSHTSTYSSHAHTLAPVSLTNLTSQTPKYSHASTVTASSVSDYPYDFPLPPEESDTSRRSSGEKPIAVPAPAVIGQKQSSKGVQRPQEFKAMQDLISALSNPAKDKKPPPTSFNLRVDTNASKSRLSMGEGLVTPGGHSIRTEGATDENGNRDWADEEHETSAIHESFTLPPADIFEEARNAAKGKGKAANPFED